MWKSQSSWPRDSTKMRSTKSYVGANATKNTQLSFPPVRGFREWSVKQENPPPGSKFQAGSRLLTECRDAVPPEVCDELAGVLGDKLYKTYMDAMQIKQRPAKPPPETEPMFRFSDAWQGASYPKSNGDVVIDHKRELRRAGCAA